MGDVATPPRDMFQELVDLRTFRQGSKIGSSRPRRSDSKRKARELADSLAGGHEEVPHCSATQLVLGNLRQVPMDLLQLDKVAMFF